MHTHDVVVPSPRHPLLDPPHLHHHRSCCALLECRFGERIAFVFIWHIRQSEQARIDTALWPRGSQSGRSTTNDSKTPNNFFSSLLFLSNVLANVCLSRKTARVCRLLYTDTFNYIQSSWCDCMYIFVFAGRSVWLADAMDGNAIGGLITRMLVCDGNNIFL